MSGLIPQKSSHCNHCRTLLNRNFGRGLIPQRSSNCSPLLSRNFGLGVNAANVLPLHPTLTSQFLVTGVIPQKSSHCSPILHRNFWLRWYFLKSPPIAAPLLHHFALPDQITSSLLQQFTPIDKLFPTLATKWQDCREDIRPGAL